MDNLPDLAEAMTVRILNIQTERSYVQLLVYRRLQFLQLTLNECKSRRYSLVCLVNMASWPTGMSVAVLDTLAQEQLQQSRKQEPELEGNLYMKPLRSH